MHTITRTWVMDNGLDIAHVELTYTLESDGVRLHMTHVADITYFDEDGMPLRRRPTDADLTAANLDYPAELGRRECEWTENIGAEKCN